MPVVSGNNHPKRRQRNCVNGHALTGDNVKWTFEKRWSKRKGEYVTYKYRECRDCRRVTKKLAMRSRRVRGLSLWKGR